MLQQLTASADFDFLRQFASLAHGPVGYGVGVPRGDDRPVLLIPGFTAGDWSLGNRYLDIPGFRAAEQSAADIDVIAHQTDTVKSWMKASREKGLKGALADRDRPFVKKA